MLSTRSLASNSSSSQRRLRRRRRGCVSAIICPLGDGLIVGTSLSYTFAPLPLLFGTSWMGFINAQAAWPLVFIALQFRSSRHAVALMPAAFVFSRLWRQSASVQFSRGGKPGLGRLFFVEESDASPTALSAGRSLVVLVVVYVTLGSGLETIATTGRIRHFTAAKSSQLNVAPLPLLESFFLGPFSAPIGGPWSTVNPKPSWMAAMAYSAVNLPSGGGDGARRLAQSAFPEPAGSTRHHRPIRLATGLAWRPGGGNPGVTLNPLAVSRNRRPAFPHSSAFPLYLPATPAALAAGSLGHRATPVALSNHAGRPDPRPARRKQAVDSDGCRR